MQFSHTFSEMFNTIQVTTFSDLILLVMQVNFVGKVYINMIYNELMNTVLQSNSINNVLLPKGVYKC